MDPSWRLDELDYAGPEHLDPDFVAGYDRKQGNPDAEESIAALRAHGLGPDATVVDVAAGTGQFALPAARAFGRVIATDVSPVMVETLSRKGSEAGLANLTVLRAGFLSYDHEGDPVDGVHCRHALHQLPDFWKVLALERIARLLRPGGVFWLRDLIVDARPGEVEGVIDAWLAGASTDPAAGYTRADFVEHLRTEFSTYRWLLEPMLDAAGFRIVDVEYSQRLYGLYTCIRR